METRYATNQLLMPALKELLDKGQTVKITITGNSMLPLLRHELDQVELMKFDEDISVGDVVLVKQFEGEYVLHRIISVDLVKRTFYIVGDAQRYLEGPIMFEQIHAVITAFYRDDNRIDVKGKRYKLFVWIWFKLIRFRPIILKILKKLRIIP